MKDSVFRELPIRSKLHMLADIWEILRCLTRQERADSWIQDLKARAVFFDEDIQQAVLMFSEQVQFQIAYDPTHGMTREIERATDQLVEWLGFIPPKSE